MTDRINRRDFLKYQVTGALCLTSGILAPKRLFAQAPPDIAVAKGGPAAATRAAVSALGGISRFVKKGQRVVIKPNMSFPTPPERASNTHPEVVRELAALCREAGAERVLVLDNPLGPAELCMETSGIAEACAVIDRRMVHTVSDPSQFSEKRIPDGKSLTETDIMKEVLRADVLIAAPVAKSHSGAGVSLSMKGMMGLVYNRMIFHRRDLHTAIVDLSTVLKADLTVIDATRVLSTGGPGGPGKVLTPDAVIASADMVAADAYTVAAFEWYGKTYRPDQVRHIREAHQRGLGRMDIENLRVKTVSA
jgi:uncharacterized protein (DUF362 family)